MDDPRVRRHDREVVERALAPAQERVALLVALELALGVDAKGVARAERVDLHRVVDHQLGRRQRVDLRRVAAHLRDRVAHRREVDDRGHAGEVLHQHARGREGDLLARLRLARPSSRAPRCPSRSTAPLPSVRSRFSSSTFSENGSRATSKRCCSASRRKISYSRPPTSSVLSRAKAVVRHRISRADLQGLTQSRRVLREVPQRTNDGPGRLRGRHLQLPSAWWATP